MLPNAARSLLTVFPCAVISLATDRILLHWKVLSGPVFQVAFEAKHLSGAENSWIAVGWSNNGAMAPADAVVGNMPGIKAYRLDGYKIAELVNDTFSLGPNPSVTTSATGSTVVKFSRTNGDGGTVPINLSGETYVIWAFSRGMLEAFGYHDYNRCATMVDQIRSAWKMYFDCCAAFERLCAVAVLSVLVTRLFPRRGLATVDFLCNKAPTTLMGPGDNVATIPGANVDKDPYAGLTPAERADKEARRERRTARRANRGAIFRSWANAMFGLPSPIPSSNPSSPLP
ncbi:unnamed protein product [Closterium sp. NIES-54]